MTVLWELHHDRKLMGMGHTARCFLVILPVIFSLLRCSRQEKKRLSFKFLSLGVDYGRISRCPRCTSQTNEPGERDLGDKIGKEKKKKNLRERTRAKRNKFTGKPRRNKELLYLFMKKESRYVKQSNFSYF